MLGDRFSFKARYHSQGITFSMGKRSFEVLRTCTAVFLQMA